MKSFARILLLVSAVVAGFVGALLLVTIIYVVADLRQFEFPYLWHLLGYPGILLVVAGIVAIIWLTVESARVVIKGRLPTVSNTKKALLISILIGLAWISEWILMERPVTVAAFESMQGEADYEHLQQQLLNSNNFSPGLFLPAVSDALSLRVMVGRVAANRPQFFKTINLGATIKSESAREHVDPTLIFYWLYQTSFYGEAAAGPLPFASQMTGETFRDLMQIHLPWWFIESPIRNSLIRDNTLEAFFGESFGWKLRYALHKATLDVSTEPYSANIFSDVYRVMSRHEGSFHDELIAPTQDALNIALRQSFHRLRDDLQLNACNTAVVAAGSNYQEFRDDLITFARAAYYKILFDFSFATRVQSLLARDILDGLAKAVPTSIWADVPHFQRMGLVAMGRDVYMPNVGKTSSIPYLLPELNCAPAFFLRTEAASAGSALASEASFWRPPNAEILWAAPFYLMRVFSEVWQAVYGEAIADVQPTATTDAAIRVIYRVRNPPSKSPTDTDSAD